ncbi:hypothetical protein AB1Y20_021380 [Prymnesium parvum]|uniref:Uncharacterized protein n=1 Tax=Prymnesium parvum TaxID=97485 RepID=A0AB34JLD0_PRYPA
MGPASDHIYPSNEQMHYASIKAARGGATRAGDGFEARVDEGGRVAFMPADPTAVSALNLRQVMQQAKLKIMTLFAELCGENVPSGYNAGRTGGMPGKPGRADRSQIGIDEVWEYCALLVHGGEGRAREGGLVDYSRLLGKEFA